MRSPRRRIPIILGSILLLAALLVLLAPRLVSTDAVTTRIEEEVARATGAAVTVGDARLTWWGRWRITVSEGSIAGTGADLAAATGSPNDLESYELVVRELNVGVSLLPLLRKELAVDAVELSGPRLAVRWDGGRAAAAGYAIRLRDLNLGLEMGIPKAGNRGAAPGGMMPADLSFALSVSADTLVLQEAPYTRADIEGRFAGRVLEVSSLAAHRSTGDLAGTLSIDFAAHPRGRLTFAARVRDVPAAALLEPVSPDIAGRLDAFLEGDLEGGCDLGDKAVIARTLAVKGRLAGGPGVLHAADWLEEASPYLGGRQDLKDIAFDDLAHRFEYTAGRYHFSDLTLTGGDTEWEGSGWVDPEGFLDLSLAVKLPAGFTPDLGNFSFLAAGLRDAEGRINLPLKLTGRTDRPTVGVDFAGLRRK